MTAQRFAGGLQTSLPCGTGRCDNLVSERRIGSLKSGVRRSLDVGRNEGQSSRHQSGRFYRKWDRVHPTRCCEVGRTPIGKSFGAKLGNSTRKIVSRNEVKAITWEYTVRSAARENLHAKCMHQPEIRPTDSGMMTAIASSD